MKIRKILSVLTLLLSVFLLASCGKTEAPQTKAPTTTTTQPATQAPTTTTQIVTTDDVTAVEPIISSTPAQTTTTTITTTTPITTTAPVVTTSPVVTTAPVTTSVTIWQTTASYDSSVWTTPLTDTLSLENIEEYYEDFDYNCINTLSGVNLIKYIQSYILVMPGMASQSYGKLRQTLLEADASLTNSGKIVLFYCRDEIEAKWDSGKTWNREHVFCKSLGGFDYERDAVGYDIHHVRPSDQVVNSTRNNSPYGVVPHTNSTAVYARYTAEKSLAGWSQNDVYEPLDCVKGDVARICFYVSVCYYMKCGGIELSKIVDDKTFATILAWNKLDPVDEYEAQRNNYGYDLQGNRNIFIDYPELADIIWG